MTFAQIANAQLPRPATYRPDLPDGVHRLVRPRPQPRHHQALPDREGVRRRVRRRLQPAPGRDLRSSARARPSPCPRACATASRTRSSPARRPPDARRAAAQRSAADPARARPPPSPAASTGPAPARRSSAPSRRARRRVRRASVPVELATGADPPSAPRRAPAASPPPGPPSPRPSKLGFAAPEADGARRASGAAARWCARAVFGGGAAVVGGLGFVVWTQLVAAAADARGPSPTASAERRARRHGQRRPERHHERRAPRRRGARCPRG